MCCQCRHLHWQLQRSAQSSLPTSTWLLLHGLRSPLDEHFEADLKLRVEAVRVVALHDDGLLAPRHKLPVVLDVRHDIEQLVWRVPARCTFIMKSGPGREDEAGLPMYADCCNIRPEVASQHEEAANYTRSWASECAPGRCKHLTRSARCVRYLPNEPPLFVVFAQVIVPVHPKQAAALVAALYVLPCWLPPDVEAAAVVWKRGPAAESSNAAARPADQATPSHAVN